MITSREPSKEAISAGCIPYFNLYKYFAEKKTEAEAIVDAYLSHTDDSAMGRLIISILTRNDRSADILEILFSRLKKKDSSALKIPYCENFKGDSNPFSVCVALPDSAKLAVMLSFYGKDVNKKFWIKNENGYEFLQLPPLFKAFLYEAKADIRLLLLYGAVLSQEVFKEVHQDFRVTEFPARIRNFEKEVLKDVNELLQKSLSAAGYNARENYGVAYLEYIELGDCYYKFALKCEEECNETSKKTLPVFYMRKALDGYLSALQCGDLYLDVANMSEELFERLRKSFIAFYDRVSEIMSPFRSNDFLNTEMSHLINLWESVSKKLEKIRGNFQQSQNDFSPDEDNENSHNQSELRQRKVTTSSAITSIADTDSSSDSDDSNEEAPLVSRPRF